MATEQAMGIQRYQAGNLPDADTPPALSNEDLRRRADDVLRSARSMEQYFRALMNAFPDAVSKNRIHLWAQAARSYIDLIEVCHEEKNESGATTG